MEQGKKEKDVRWEIFEIFWKIYKLIGKALVTPDLKW